MTSIEWTRGDDGTPGKTWNPTRGCSRVSPGCDNCYAMRMARRSDVPGGAYEGLTRIGKRGVDWSGKVRLVPEQLEVPLRWRKPRRIFVNSMSDLFHESIPLIEVAATLGVMALACHHTYQILTKRPAHMKKVVEALDLDKCLEAAIRLGVNLTKQQSKRVRDALPKDSPFRHDANAPIWPLPNVWLGVSAEDQRRLDERWPLLAKTPAAVRFISGEPLLGDLTLRCAGCGYSAKEHLTPDQGGCSGLFPDWFICGGESGNGARPLDIEWVRSIVEQCRDAGVACFVKQLGRRPFTTNLVWCNAGQTLTVNPEAGGRVFVNLRSRKGGDPAEWPEKLRIREFPS